jgi:hypothetical protein
MPCTLHSTRTTASASMGSLRNTVSFLTSDSWLVALPHPSHKHVLRHLGAVSCLAWAFGVKQLRIVVSLCVLPGTPWHRPPHERWAALGRSTAVRCSVWRHAPAVVHAVWYVWHCGSAGTKCGATSHGRCISRWRTLWCGSVPRGSIVCRAPVPVQQAVTCTLLRCLHCRLSCSAACAQGAGGRGTATRGTHSNRLPAVAAP